MKKKLPILLTLILTLVLCVCGLFACENTNLLGNGNGTNVEGDAGSGENDGGNNNEGTGSGESGSGGNNQQQEVDWNLVYTVEGNKITGLTPYGKTLTQLVIPNAINGVNITSIGSSAFSGCASLTSVTIGNNVQSIGSYAFRGCTELTSVTIGGGVQSIGSDAFYRCTSLKSVTIGENVQSIGSWAFWGCGSLTSITIPNSVQSIGSSAFSGCYKLVEVINKSPSITIEKGADSNGDIGYYALKVFNSGDTYENKFTNDNGYIIYNNEAEKVLWRYEGTETNLTLPSYITAINNYAFYNCGSLTSVIIGNNVQSIGDRAFYWCESLTSTTIGSGVQSIGYYAFYNCTAIEEINFNAINCANLSEYNDVFYNAGKNGNGIKVTFGNSVTHIPAYLFYPDTYSDSYSPKITSVTIGSGVQS